LIGYFKDQKGPVPSLDISIPSDLDFKTTPGMRRRRLQGTNSVDKSGATELKNPGLRHWLDPLGLQDRRRRRLSPQATQGKHCPITSGIVSLDDYCYIKERGRRPDKCLKSNHQRDGLDSLLPEEDMFPEDAGHCNLSASQEELGYVRSLSSMWALSSSRNDVSDNWKRIGATPGFSNAVVDSAARDDLDANWSAIVNASTWPAGQAN